MTFKILLINLPGKNIKAEIISQNYSADELKYKIFKLRLSFEHATHNALNRNDIVKVKFNTKTKIDNNIIHSLLQKTCTMCNVDYNKVVNYIKNLELQNAKCNYLHEANRQ